MKKKKFEEENGLSLNLIIMEDDGKDCDEILGYM